MSIGRTLSKAELDNACAGIAMGLFATMDNIVKVKAVLDGFTAQGLVDAALCTNLTDANLLKSAFTDMANLSTIWAGGAATGTMPRDHRVFAKSLLGVGLY